MDQPAPSFKDIIAHNQLVNGRLHLSQADLSRLLQSLEKKNVQNRKNMQKEHKLIRSHISRVHELKQELKYNKESLRKAFYPSSKNISLLYKKLGNTYYIKARLYWQGKQREVQVGSISNVIETINKLISNKLLAEISPIKSKKLSWEKIKQEPVMTNAIKTIASIKFQEYILRQLFNEYFRKTESEKDETQVVKEAKEVLKSPEPIENQAEEYDHSEFEEDTPMSKTDWYVQWRRNNL